MRYFIDYDDNGASAAIEFAGLAFSAGIKVVFWIDLWTGNFERTRRTALVRIPAPQTIERSPAAICLIGVGV